MKFHLSVFCVLFFFAGYAQDSTMQKHCLFKLSGISFIGGSSFLNYYNNQGYISRQNLLSMWPDFANKSYSNYKQNNNGAYGNGEMFGVYFNFDNYRRKKSIYSLNSQTNVGITVIGQNNLSTNFTDISATRLDTLFIKVGSAFYPKYYRDNVTINSTFLNYQSISLGMDIQQVFSSNQKRIFSFFGGIGTSVGFSVNSAITEWSRKATGINVTEYSNYNYQTNSYLKLENEKDTVIGLNSYKAKSSVLYNFYFPFGFNIRCGKNEMRKLSHLYLTVQCRVGYEILKIQSANAFAFTTSYITSGLKYRF